jgi:hypothetical protein
MRLLHRYEVPNVPTLGARSAWPYAAVAGALLVAVVGLAIAAVRTKMRLVWLPAGWLGLMAWVFSGAARAAWRPSNWTIRADDDGLYAQFRSFMNYHFTDERPSVVAIEWNEIAAVRKTLETVRRPDMDGGTTTERVVYLDIRLVRADTRALGEALAAERTDMGPKDGIVRSRANDEPVLLPAPDLVRVVWSGETPSIDVVLRKLGERAPVEGVANLAAIPDLDYEAQAAKLDELGHRVEAIALVRRHSGCALDEARARLEALRSRQSR